MFCSGCRSKGLAKGFANLIQLNLVLILLLVCKTTMSIIRGSFLRHFIPLHKHVVFHKYIGAFIFFVATPGHVFSHLIGVLTGLS